MNKDDDNNVTELELKQLKKDNWGFVGAVVTWIVLARISFYLMEVNPFIHADLLGSGLAAFACVIPLLQNMHTTLMAGNREDLKNMEIEMKQNEAVASYTTVKEMI